MTPNDLETTIEDATFARPARSTGSGRPALVATLLYHPDLARIGEQALVDGPAALSRVDLRFGADGRPARLLEFRGVSRTALALSPVAGGWELRPAGPLAWQLDGRPGGEVERLGDDRLAGGVVVGLGPFVLRCLVAAFGLVVSTALQVVAL